MIENHISNTFKLKHPLFADKQGLKVLFIVQTYLESIL